MSESTKLFELEPDLGQTRRFLRAVIGGSDQTCFQTFKSRPEFNVEPKWKFGSLSECSEWLINDNRRGAGVYFVVNYCDGAGRSSSNVTRVRSLFVDLDGAPVEPLMNCEIKPHVIVESSPGRYQAFWRCKSVALGEFTPVQKALIKKFNADPACKDLGRVMRVPGFWHLKKDPFLCRIHFYNMGFPYERDMIIEKLGLKVNWTDERPGFVEDSNDKDIPVIPEGQRHEMIKRLCVSLRKMGFTGKRLHEAVMRENSVRCVPALPESEIAKMTSWANQNVKTADQRLASQVMYETFAEDTKKRREIISCDKLYEMKLPAVKWVIKDLLPEGLTILAGAPKVGKSWLAQSLTLAVATGNDALGHFPSNQGQVLHLALEDTVQRFQDRMIKLYHMKPLNMLSNAIFAQSWDSLPDAVQSLQEWISSQTKPRLIVIDTFQKIRSRSVNRFEDNAYAKDYAEVGMLHHLAARNNIAILLIHHKRKALSDDPFNGVSGSSGITGAADAIWIFDKPDREVMAGTLLISGRDVSDRKYALAWSGEDQGSGWRYVAPVGDPIAPEAEEHVLLAMLEIGRPTSVSEICLASGVQQRQVYRTIEKLRQSGMLEKAAGLAGRYVLTPEGKYLASQNLPMDHDYPSDWNEI